MTVRALSDLVSDFLPKLEKPLIYILVSCLNALAKAKEFLFVKDRNLLIGVATDLLVLKEADVLIEVL